MDMFYLADILGSELRALDRDRVGAPLPPPVAMEKQPAELDELPVVDAVDTEESPICEQTAENDDTPAQSDAICAALDHLEMIPQASEEPTSALLSESADDQTTASDCDESEAEGVVTTAFVIESDCSVTVTLTAPASPSSPRLSAASSSASSAAASPERSHSSSAASSSSSSSSTSPTHNDTLSPKQTCEDRAVVAPPKTVSPMSDLSPLSAATLAHIEAMTPRHHRLSMAPLSPVASSRDEGAAIEFQSLDSFSPCHAAVSVAVDPFSPFSAGLAHRLGDHSSSVLPLDELDMKHCTPRPTPRKSPSAISSARKWSAAEGATADNQQLEMNGGHILIAEETNSIDSAYQTELAASTSAATATISAPPRSLSVAQFLSLAMILLLGVLVVAFVALPVEFAFASPGAAYDRFTLMGLVDLHLPGFLSESLMVDRWLPGVELKEYVPTGSSGEGFFC